MAIIGGCEVTRREHVETLCTQLRVKWCELEHDMWKAGQARPGMILAPVPVGEVQHLTCLHELGHVFCGHVENTKRNRMIQRDKILRITAEFEAWTWALDQYTLMGWEITDEGKETVAYSLNSYLQDINVDYQSFDQLFKRVK